MLVILDWNLRGRELLSWKRPGFLSTDLHQGTFGEYEVQSAPLTHELSQGTEELCLAGRQVDPYAVDGRKLCSLPTWVRTAQKHD